MKPFLKQLSGIKSIEHLVSGNECCVIFIVFQVEHGPSQFRLLVAVNRLGYYCLWICDQGKEKGKKKLDLCYCL